MKGYIYVYKKVLKYKIKFVYRCQNRNCDGQITNDKDNILKILSKNKDEDITYREGKNEHTCVKKKSVSQILKKIRNNY